MTKYVFIFLPLISAVLIVIFFSVGGFIAVEFAAVLVSIPAAAVFSINIVSFAPFHFYVKNAVKNRRIMTKYIKL
jgi:hypothetical protein